MLLLKRKAGERTGYIAQLGCNQLISVALWCISSHCGWLHFLPKECPAPPGRQTADLRVTWYETSSQDNNNGDFKNFLNRCHIFSELILLLSVVEQWNKWTLRINIQRSQCQAFASLLHVIKVKKVKAQVYSLVSKQSSIRPTSHNYPLVIGPVCS